MFPLSAGSRLPGYLIFAHNFNPLRCACIASRGGLPVAFRHRLLMPLIQRTFVESAVYSHLTQRLCSHQWRDFLNALAGELTHDLTPKNLRSMMRRTGERFAQQHALGGSGTVDDLQKAMNLIWRGQDWGWVDISEANDHLMLAHYCAPLQAAFGAGHHAWTIGFLEGAYECWMRELGADAQLHVSQVGEPDAMGTVVFRFGK
ncbi:cellulose biosynthesis protein BcsD [Bordetella ansorpii]|uniref:cellulose biosynthesis protein BcsD n=1 Tax=Bordetella ansorpii TaxID=288768 RepID=UPI001E572E00|nr:cellulose synthase [Bordetella ansorpii]